MPLDDGGGSDSGNQQNMSTEDPWEGSFIMPKRDPLYIVVPMTIVYSVIFVTGVIGNTITCLVIAKHKYMHTATNYYLFSLAISDLILLVSGLPQEMWSIWSRYPYIFGEIFCQLRGLFAEMSANATVLTITAFTAERYVAICHPFMAQSMSKLSRAVKLIIGIWLVAVLFAIPQALQFTVSSWDDSPEMAQCNIREIFLMDSNLSLSTVSFTLSTLLFFVLPMTVITVLYALIGLRLRRSDRLKRTVTIRSTTGEKKISSPEYRANSSSKVLKMLVAVVVAFFICWAPFHAQRLIAIFGVSQASTGDIGEEFLHQLYGISTYISGVLYYMSTTINPILYHIMSLKFRAAFKETVLRCCGSGWTDHQRSLRRRSSSTTTTGPGGGRPKYRRVSIGQATISLNDNGHWCWRWWSVIGKKPNNLPSPSQPIVPIALSDWTMISNSSLKDVDGNDLRDELVGYAIVAASDSCSKKSFSIN
ncbi:pyrokinin-1 receptor-like isoform X2 [Daktulosphaira vitifoliae]|nr:pyrokinin-1 receptor-like isoform X2 [Daktulosphaira vitifoliae]XP_050533499.1 pyrokinin-1 receptor-like isoform X2 [Daktulosphaira vitifoliae]XP_050533500.1 pyrokinin-1 receptor-like isoform X2 [Daktulosphaira vitifoliae]XP_050533501.1 pyrokinin-1 receptor-like isoform X2 [Daktulosphaira vitifoliae]